MSTTIDALETRAYTKALQCYFTKAMESRNPNGGGLPKVAAIVAVNCLRESLIERFGAEGKIPRTALQAMHDFMESKR